MKELIRDLNKTTQLQQTKIVLYLLVLLEIKENEVTMVSRYTPMAVKNYTALMNQQLRQYALSFPTKALFQSISFYYQQIISND